jgi:serine/threonine-protein kinase
MVADRYLLGPIIGEGGFGRVYSAKDTRLGVDVAVKVIHPWFAQDEEWLQRFAEEARTAAKIGHPGVVRVTDTGTDADVGPYTVSELVDGESLHVRLDREGRLDADEAAELISQAAQALGAAHDRRIVHRDVKPGNLLVGTDGRVRVCDFGIARLQSGATRKSTTHTIAGTPGYMAPEQVQGKATGPAADQYALAVVLYELLAGRLPFEADSPIAMGMAHINEPVPSPPPSTPPHVARALRRALAKAPKDRFSDIRALAAAVHQPDPASTRSGFDRWRTAITRRLGRTPDEATTTALPVPQPNRRRRAVAASLLMTTLAAAALAAVFLLAGDDPPANGQAAREGGEATQTENAEPTKPTPTPKPPRKVKVPKLAGLPLAEARRVARQRDVAVDVRREASRATTAGVVSSQTPVAGRRVEEFATIFLTVSTGPPPADVPRLVGGSLADAQSRLANLGLRYATREVAANKPAGTVVSVSPRAGTSLPVGSTVTLSIAREKAWRHVGTYTLDADGSTPPFRIDDEQWRVRYTLSLRGCEDIIGCDPPTLWFHGPTVEYVDLSEGTHTTYGPDVDGRYQLEAETFSDGTFDLTLVVEQFS